MPRGNNFLCEFIVGETGFTELGSALQPDRQSEIQFSDVRLKLAQVAAKGLTDWDFCRRKKCDK